MKSRLIALSVVLAALLALPAPASATDGTLYTAWTQGDAEGKQIGKRWNRAFRTWRRSDFRTWRPLYRASRAYVRYAAKTRASVAQQSGSSSTGAKVRNLALRALRLYRLSYVKVARGVRLVGRGRPRAAQRLFRRAARQERSAMRLHRRVDRGFRALGFG